MERAGCPVIIPPHAEGKPECCVLDFLESTEGRRTKPMNGDGRIREDRDRQSLDKVYLQLGVEVPEAVQLASAARALAALSVT